MSILSFLDNIGDLSLWFMGIIVLVFATGAFYGIDYLKHYRTARREIAWHWVMYIAAFGSMLALCCLENAIAFLVAWEIMALSSYFLIIFESWKEDVIKAGMNFFIQSHISVIFLTAGFMLMAAKTGSYDFSVWSAYSGNCGVPFTLICIGFAIKAGFLPFHTWLPVAHPAAPAHISGVMSGVIIKIGIFGIIKMIAVFRLSVNMLVAGYIILGIAALSGVYGVILAIMQHNLKKLLAYHSIENIGIIGMGIGLGCIGLGMENYPLAALGMGGALLHTLNHALFKSSLFFTAGNVYHATGTLDIEKLGGLAKKLPLTAAFFLISAVAICGLPPMNGFMSELAIYLGLFSFMGSASGASIIGAAGAILALVLIGGLAIMCFTKAFSVVFLGSPRSSCCSQAHEFGPLRTIPLAIESLIMLSIGLAPQLWCRLLEGPLSEIGIAQIGMAQTSVMTTSLSPAALASCILVGTIVIIALIRALSNRRKTITCGQTWGCGYTAPTPKIQYTATSFVKTFALLCSRMLGFHRHEEKIEGIFPAKPIEHESENFDRLEKCLVEKPVRAYLKLSDVFAFLENGRIQSYILYGIIFILAAGTLTLILC